MANYAPSGGDTGYETFDELMDDKYPTYDWEKITVTTRDNYELSMYHIYNKTARLAADGSKGPIMWMHGGFQDPIISL